MLLNSRLVKTLIRDLNRFLTIISKVTSAVVNAIALVLDGLADIEPVLWVMTRLIEVLALLLYVKLTTAVVNFGIQAVKAMYDYIASLITAKVTTDGLVISTNLLLSGIVLAIAGLTYAFKAVGEEITGTKKDTNDVVAAVISAFTYMGSFLYNIIAFVVDVVLAAIKVVASAILGLWAMINEMFSDTAQWIDTIFGTDFSSKISNNVTKAFEDIQSMWGKGTWLRLKGLDERDLEAQEAGKNYLASMKGDLDIMSSKGIDVNSVAGTVNTKGEMSITEEDLKLLKDVAATEFVNRYTTLRPTLTANFGDVRETADVNAIAQKIGDLMEQALTESLY